MDAWWPLLAEAEFQPHDGHETCSTPWSGAIPDQRVAVRRPRTGPSAGPADANQSVPHKGFRRSSSAGGPIVDKDLRGPTRPTGPGVGLAMPFCGGGNLTPVPADATDQPVPGGHPSRPTRCTQVTRAAPAGKPSWCADVDHPTPVRRHHGRQDHVAEPADIPAGSAVRRPPLRPPPGGRPARPGPVGPPGDQATQDLPTLISGPLSWGRPSTTWPS